MNTKASIFDRYPELQSIPADKFPKHVLVIPDGNGRWAQRDGKFVLEGHKKGAEKTEIILRELSQISAITHVTIWGFSADNWKRSERETEGLFKLIQYQLEKTFDELHQRNARFIHLGRKDRIPESLRLTIQKAETETERNTGQVISGAIDFGGEDQELRILEAARNLSKDKPITKDTLWSLRDGKGVVPAADLLIRTAGQRRTSDIGWLNGAPTELYFIDKLFPDIETSDIVQALTAFSQRERRMGARLQS